MEKILSEKEVELRRFEPLHDHLDDPRRFFKDFFEAVGLEKVRNYNDDLLSVTNFSEQSARTQAGITFCWAYFIQGDLPLTKLTKTLNLTEDHNQDEILTLIRCAYLLRFPKVDHHNMTQDAMLSALEKRPTTQAQDITPEVANLKCDPMGEILSEKEVELLRFEQLHNFDTKKPTRPFKRFFRAAGLDKVRKYNDDLLRITQFAEQPGKITGMLAVYWTEFTQGNEDRLSQIMKLLHLTKSHHGADILTLIRCAYFLRFPEVDHHNMTQDAMLSELTKRPTTQAQDITPEVAKVDWNQDVVQAGFRAEYQRYDLIVLPTLQTLCEFTRQWKPNIYKAPYTSIIGPTMSGKTRLLMELARHICVVYVCLRPSDSTGQPPRSKLARVMLPPMERKLDMVAYYLRFLTAIFDTVTTFFSKEDVRNLTLEDQLQRWYEYSFQTDRTPKKEFYSSVKKAMKVVNAEDLQVSLSSAANRMSKSIKHIPKDNLKVLIAIDEASNLIPPIDQTRGIPYFRSLRRALAQIDHSLGIFSVFTDTTSKVANSSPLLAQDPSARDHNLGHELFAPIFKISALDLFVATAPKSWDELLSPTRLFSYGSPFYGLYFNGITGKKTTPASIQDTLLIAEAKLLCQSPPPNCKQLSEAQCFALLGSMIQTRLCLHSPINSTLVSSHAAHCLYIDPTREMIISDYPPQFVYATAANAFLVNNEDCWVKCINQLAVAVQKGLVALGDAGEMATRLILLRAMQKTQRMSNGERGSIPSGTSVRLLDFLRTLTGQDSLTKLYEDHPNNRKVLLDRGRIFFNHSSRIAYTPDVTDLMDFLHRGLAVQCKRGQPGLDDLFTIYLEPTTGASDLDLKNITFCGVQTKNQSNAPEWKDSFKWSQSYAGIEGISTGNPYLILLFSLRSKPIRTPSQWKPPLNSHDTGRVYHHFLGLEEIQCLTPKMREALNFLIHAVPEDLLKLHNDRDACTENWVKHLSPIFYHRGERAVRTPAPPLPTELQRPPTPIAARQSVKRGQPSVQNNCSAKKARNHETNVSGETSAERHKAR